MVLYIYGVVNYKPQANATPNKIKTKLVYRDEDELETGMQKVQPLTFLGQFEVYVACTV